MILESLHFGRPGLDFQSSANERFFAKSLSVKKAFSETKRQQKFRLQALPDYQKYIPEVDENVAESDPAWQEVLEHKQWFQSAMRGFFSKAKTFAQP